MTFHWGVFELGGATFNFPPTTSHATPIKILTFFQKSWRTLKDGQCCVDCGYTSHLRKKIFGNILIPDFLRNVDPPNGHPDLTRNLVTTTATPLHLNDYPLVSLLALKAPLVLVLSLGIEKLGGTVNTPWWWVDNELHFEQVKLPQKWGEDFFSSSSSFSHLLISTWLILSCHAICFLERLYGKSWVEEGWVGLSFHEANVRWLTTPTKLLINLSLRMTMLSKKEGGMPYSRWLV